MVSSENRAISADLPLLRELDREVRRGCTTLESEWSSHGELMYDDTEMRLDDRIRGT